MTEYPGTMSDHQYTLQDGEHSIKRKQQIKGCNNINFYKNENINKILF
jgi:hypothetical protein